VPLQFASVLRKKDVFETPESFFGVATIGRLKPGFALSEAKAELTQMQESLFAQFIPERFRHDPFFEKAYLTVSSARSGLPNYLTHTYARPLFLMQGLVGIVLLVCCVNIGGLMMARATGSAVADGELCDRDCGECARRGWGVVRKRLAAAFL